MLNLTQLDLDQSERLGESLIADVYRVPDKNSKKQFLVKKIRPEFIIEGVIAHLEQQLSHFKRLDIPDLLIPNMESDGRQRLQLVYPCPQGKLLHTWLLEQAQPDIKTVLEIGIALADCLAKRHKAALIHKAIKPNNIVIQTNPIRIQLVGELQIVDAAQLSQFVNHASYLRDTLPYHAPEVTGQIRTRVDYCSDLYSLGTVLYECLTGAPPFLSDDPQSLIHSHLAQEPKPAWQAAEGCPRVLSDILSTLLRKQPEKRYQSAIGLRADLQTCLSLWEKTDRVNKKPMIAAFQLRQHEINYQI